MIDREKVIKALEFCTQHGSMCGSDCNGYYERYTDDGYVIKLVNEYRSKCPYGKCKTGCVKTLAKDALELIKEQEPVKPTVSVDTWICSKCGHTLESQELIDDKENPQVLIHEQYEYCPNCGRKVKQNEDN